MALIPTQQTVGGLAILGAIGVAAFAIPEIIARPSSAAPPHEQISRSRSGSTSRWEARCRRVTPRAREPRPERWPN
jgi:hypothetical protein